MNKQEAVAHAAAIRVLNDRLRATFSGGKVMMTDEVSALEPPALATLLSAVQTFNAFSGDNDPYGEHDFGAVDIEGERYFWKIDYYAPDMEHGSENPADPEQTTRVLLIMRASEY